MQQNIPDDETEMKREESTIATGDVTLSITNSDVQSMITQVSRDDANRKTTLPPDRARHAHPGPPPRKRSLFSRFFCCASQAVAGQTVSQIGLVNGGSGFSLPKRANSKNANKDQELVAKGTRKKCLALDLDETLVHSSFQPVDCASFVISVVIEGIVHNVYVIKRPGVDEFIERLAEHYELIVFTASLSKYADPLLDLLDNKRVISKRLFREHCVFYDGHYVKDLSTLNRDISQTIIVDNSPMSYIFHPENAIDCSSYFDDPNDVELWQIADFLVSIKGCDDVRSHCRNWREWCRNNPSL